ncbi:bifunctional DNA primase/polymerase [Krasilnikovia cinnamomea]|nr:bifunctional DNA primase/polymerase [Krasilnikovia cinnamomea]
MQWRTRHPVVPVRLAERLGVERLRLRRAARRYAAHGWAVTPGACLTGDRFSCGRAGCPIMGCHPALESWEDDASTDRARVSDWWRHRPYTVLLATGVSFDVVDVPAALGLRALGAARLHAGVLGLEHADGRGPVAVTPAGRWMFFVRPGTPLRPELDACLDIVRHGRGSWVPAAPSRMPEGPVHWAVAPDEVHWRLPAAGAVQTMLCDALASLRRRADPARPPHGTGQILCVPRQLSTSRRAG